MACGTGAGSVFSVLAEKNLVTGKAVDVSVPGGKLTVTAVRDTENSRIKDIFLTGPTNLVAEGIITDEDLFL